MANGQSGTTGPGNQSFVGLVAALISKVAAPFSVVAGQLALLLTSPLRVAGGALELFNSGSVAGRANEPILIDASTFTATLYSTPTWTAGKYKYLKWIIRLDSAVGTLSQANFTMTGLTGSYTNRVFGGAGTTPLSVDTNAGWNLQSATPLPNSAIVEMWISKGGGRFGFTQLARIAASSAVQLYSSFWNDDTTNDITGAVLHFQTATSVTGYIEVWGVPS